jgi:hypothetical protein
LGEEEFLGKLITLNTNYVNQLIEEKSMEISNKNEKFISQKDGEEWVQLGKVAEKLRKFRVKLKDNLRRPSFGNADVGVKKNFF